ncbi:MAG: hypothetical protein SGARI_001593 [Bacillariaceae sp.]
MRVEYPERFLPKCPRHIRRRRKSPKRERPRRPPRPPNWHRPETKQEREQLRESLFAAVQHEMLCYSDVQFGLRYGIDLSDFCATIDPLRDKHNLDELSTKLPSLLTAPKLEKASLQVKALERSLRKDAEPSPQPIKKPKSRKTALQRIVIRCFPLYHEMPYVLQREERKSKLEELRIRNTYYNNMNDKMLKKLVLFTNDDMPIVIDTGASISITPFKSDFIEPPRTNSKIPALKGLAHKTEVAGWGKVSWIIGDMYGVVHRVETYAYYVPEATIRLYSPQSHFQEQNNGSLFQ